MKSKQIKSASKRASRTVDLDIGLPTAKDINEVHKLAMASATKAVEYAIRCGEMLATRKKKLDHGEFMPWIEKNCDFSYKTAQRYMLAARESANGVSISAIRHLVPSGLPGAKKQEKPDTTARSVKGAVMNPPESAAQGSEAGNRNMPSGVTPGQLRPAVPASVAVIVEPNEDAPERPDDVDEDAALAAAEADLARRLEVVLKADDKLAAAHAQLKQQAALIGTLETTRDGYMRGKEAVTKMLQAEQRKTSKLEREIAKLREENEGLRERISVMEEAA